MEGLEPEIYSVAEITKMVADQLSHLGVLWIEAEIVQLKIASSQHWYFDIKDSEDGTEGRPGAQRRGWASTRRGRSAVLSCTMFKNAQRTISGSFRPKVGDKVRLKAKTSIYLGRLQLNVTRMEPAGAGERARRRAALKEKLSKEGLFAAELKRPIPPFPKIVGIVTSRTSAALQDMLTILSTRMPSIQIILAHCTTEGAAAAPDIARAIEWLNRDGRAEVLLIGRGGGSADSLSGFDEEVVVRAVAGSRIPTVVAVGHEPDHSLADLAADLRSATPTHAAEDITKTSRTQLLEHILGLEQNALRVIRRRIEQERLSLRRMSPRPPVDLIATGHIRVDQLSRELWVSLDQRIQQGRTSVLGRLAQLQAHHPQRKLERLSAKQQQLATELSQAFRMLLSDHKTAHHSLSVQLSPALLSEAISADRARLRHSEQTLLSGAEHMLLRLEHSLAQQVARLEALSPLSVLKRGYSVTLHKQQVVTRTAQIKRGDKLSLRFQDGQARVQVLATGAAVQLPLI